jgi:predicted DNA-binding transcriptional regulator YafY
MNKVSMMLKIIVQLQTAFIITARDLADRLETSPRNIKAYIETLRNCGIPIEGISGPQGGFYLSQTYEFKSPKLDDMEFNALLLAEELLTKNNGFPHESEIKTAFAKIKAAQGEIMINSDFIMEDTCTFSKSHIDTSDSLRKNLDAIRKAILNKNRIKVNHFNPVKNEYTNRKIDPYNLVYKESSWYVIGYCYLRDKVRIFKIIRMDDIDVLNEKYDKSRYYSLYSFMSNTLNLNPGREYDVEILFYPPASTWIKEKNWLPTQEIYERDNNSIVFKATVNGLTDIKKWILGFGENAKVLKPKELVVSIAKTIDIMKNQYKNDRKEATL